MQARGIECPLVLMTRVREPLDFYLSFYRWGVAYRQVEHPAAYGSTFEEWVSKVPNLQTSLMLADSKAAYLAALKGDPTDVEAHLSPLWTVAPQPTPDA